MKSILPLHQTLSTERPQILESVTTSSRFITTPSLCSLVCSSHSEAYLHYFTLHSLPPPSWPPSIHPPLPLLAHLPPLNDRLTCHSLTSSPALRSLLWALPSEPRPICLPLQSRLFSLIQAAQNEASSHFERHLNQSEHPPPPALHTFIEVHENYESGVLHRSRSVFTRRQVSQSKLNQERFK